eukprot:3753702-Pleurochrysis_carterae.AAC.1
MRLHSERVSDFCPEHISDFCPDCRLSLPRFSPISLPCLPSHRSSDTHAHAQARLAVGPRTQDPQQLWRRASAAPGAHLARGGGGARACLVPTTLCRLCRAGSAASPLSALYTAARLRISQSAERAPRRRVSCSGVVSCSASIADVRQSAGFLGPFSAHGLPVQ